MISKLRFVQSKPVALVILGIFSFNTAALALTGEQVYSQAAKSVVVVRTPSGLGSGVFITDKLIATNCHVTKGFDSVEIEFFKSIVTGTVVGKNEQNDVCAVKIDQSLPGTQPVRGTRRWEAVNVGESIYAIGAPSGYKYTLTSGIVSQKREYEGGQLVQFDAAISPGNSGGGLFDVNANLIGLPSFIGTESEYAQNINFAWSVNVFPEPLLTALASVGRNSSSADEGAVPRDTSHGEDKTLRPSIEGNQMQSWRVAFTDGRLHESLEIATLWANSSPDTADAWVSRGRSSDAIKAGSGFEFFRHALECNHSHQNAMYYGALSARQAGNYYDYRRLLRLLQKANPRRASELETSK